MSIKQLLGGVERLAGATHDEIHEASVPIERDSEIGQDIIPLLPDPLRLLNGTYNHHKNDDERHAGLTLQASNGSKTYRLHPHIHDTGDYEMRAIEVEGKYGLDTPMGETDSLTITPSSDPGDFPDMYESLVNGMAEQLGELEGAEESPTEIQVTLKPADDDRYETGMVAGYTLILPEEGEAPDLASIVSDLDELHAYTQQQLSSLPAHK